MAKILYPSVLQSLNVEEVNHKDCNRMNSTASRQQEISAALNLAKASRGRTIGGGNFYLSYSSENASTKPKLTTQDFHISTIPESYLNTVQERKNYDLKFDELDFLLSPNTKKIDDKRRDVVENEFSESIAAKKVMQGIFDIGLKKIGDEHVIRLVRDIVQLGTTRGSLPTIRHVVLRDNRLTDLGVTQIVGLLSSSDKFCTVNLSENSIRKKAAESLATYICKSVKLVKLSLCKCGISDVILKVLLSGVDSSHFAVPTLQSDDSYTLQGGPSGSGVMDSPQLSMLTSFNSAPGHDFDRAPPILGLGLCSLRSLLLADNKICDIGAAAIANILKNCQLTELDLSWNEIRCNGMVALSAALEGDTRLESLDISWNAIGGASDISGLSARALSRLFQHNRSLTHIDLSQNQLTSADCDVISKGLRLNHSLLGLHMTGNGGKIDAYGYLMPEAMPWPLEAAHAMTRIIGMDHVTGREAWTLRNNCWICSHWRESKFCYTLSPADALRLRTVKIEPKGGKGNLKLKNIAAENEHTKMKDMEQEKIDSVDEMKDLFGTRVRILTSFDKWQTEFMVPVKPQAEKVKHKHGVNDTHNNTQYHDNSRISSQQYPISPEYSLSSCHTIAMSCAAQNDSPSCTSLSPRHFRRPAAMHDFETLLVSEPSLALSATRTPLARSIRQKCRQASMLGDGDDICSPCVPHSQQEINMSLPLVTPRDQTYTQTRRQLNTVQSDVSTLEDDQSSPMTPDDNVEGQDRDDILEHRQNRPQFELFRMVPPGTHYFVFMVGETNDLTYDPFQPHVSTQQLLDLGMQVPEGVSLPVFVNSTSVAHLTADEELLGKRALVMQNVEPRFKNTSAGPPRPPWTVQNSLFASLSDQQAQQHLDSCFVADWQYCKFSKSKLAGDLTVKLREVVKQNYQLLKDVFVQYSCVYSSEVYFMTIGSFNEFVQKCKIIESATDAVAAGASVARSQHVLEVPQPPRSPQQREAFALFHEALMSNNASTHSLESVASWDSTHAHVQPPPPTSFVAVELLTGNKSKAPLTTPRPPVSSSSKSNRRPKSANAVAKNTVKTSEAQADQIPPSRKNSLIPASETPDKRKLSINVDNDAKNAMPQRRGSLSLKPAGDSVPTRANNARRASVGYRSTGCTRTEVDMIFIANCISGPRHEHNVKRSLCRFQFLDCVVALAISKFANTGICNDAVAALRKLIDCNIKPHAERDDLATFHRTILLTEEIDLVMRANLKFLQSMFKSHSGRDNSPLEPKAMCLREWTEAVASTLTLDIAFSDRPVKLSFCRSKTQCEDIFDTSNNFKQLTFMEFLEAIVRSCHLMLIQQVSVPVNDNINSAKSLPALQAIHSTTDDIVRLDSVASLDESVVSAAMVADFLTKRLRL